MIQIKTRFAPSPTGSLHVGGARTALACYLVAKKFGGTMLLRIEDTDRARHQEEAVEKILADLAWLGIEIDEGVGAGGDNGPYRQSERLEIYQAHIQKLLDEGKAYYAFDTPEELEALRDAARAEKRDFKYSRPQTLPTQADVDAARAEGRPVVVRLLSDKRDVSFVDEVFGEITIPADQTDDFIIAKGDGWPTYHLANVVDDHHMGVNFILRGQEFLGQTWRHVLLREALGFPAPRYAHLALIMDMKGRKLSKRDGDVEVDLFRRAGYLPEALVNFIALLGWNPGDEREFFTMDDLAEAFEISRVSKTNAKFDRDKLMSFNTDWAAALEADRLLGAFTDYLSTTDSPLADQDEATLSAVLAACSGFRRFDEVLAKVAPIFMADDAYEYDPKAVKKGLEKGEGAGYARLELILPEIEALGDWTAEAIHNWMGAYCEANEIGFGKIGQPMRVALAGGMFGPAIPEMMVLLGKERAMARIQRTIAMRGE
ncbi:MAG: glutamate--tRNA ligase [Phycisphaerales bacterium]|jgi:glutamyl-tRNA synthetase|nr:glutamate--tRNA ligase [Phycisphaerales bacterium]MBT7170695.1 glutamate--tRNA ligase [Phycisphaerales bacterium]